MSVRVGLLKLVKSIRARPVLFSFLVLFQFFLLSAGALAFVHYQLLLLQDVQAVLGPLQGANFDDTQLQNGQPFIEDFLPVYQGYDDLTHHLTALTLWGVLLVLVGGGLLWIGCYYLLEPTLTGIGIVRFGLRYIIGFGVVTIVFAVALMSLIQTALVNIEGDFTIYLVELGIIGLILGIIFLCSTLNAFCKSWKEWIMGLWQSVSRHLLRTLLVLLVCGLIVCVVLGVAGLLITLDYGLLLILLMVVFSVILIILDLYLLIMIPTHLICRG